MMNHPLFNQQVIHQSHVLHDGDMHMQHGYSAAELAFKPENAMLPMTQIVQVNAFQHQLVAHDNTVQNQNHSLDNRYSNQSNYHNCQHMIQYKPSGDDMSELTDTRMDESRKSFRNEAPRYVSMEEDERSLNRCPTCSFIDIEEEKNMRMTSPLRPHSSSKLQRSTSTRSLTFNDNPEQPQRSSRQVPSSNVSRMSIGEATREEFEQRLILFLQEMESVNELDADDPAMMRAFLTRPSPKGIGLVKCYIKRSKGIKSKLFPEYRVYLKETNAFLMTSKKRMGNATSNYLISMGRNDFDNRQSPNVLGKLRSNFMGTEYTIYDGGRNPQYESSFEDDGDGNVRCELGAILYAAATTLGSKGPRKIKACIGKLDEDDNPTKVWRPMSEEDDRMVTCFKDKNSTEDKLVPFVNKHPTWNEDIKAYALNFNGRVTEASVKNFQLIDESDPEKIYLQFGRAGKDEFILDFQWPLSPLQAFAFALSSFDSKLGCD